MKKLYIFLGMALILCFSSCNDWLDVRPETQQKEEKQFSTYKGFRDALTGCYMSMANTNIYGEKLTMSHIESLANLWTTSASATGDRLADYYLSQHAYDSDDARTAMQGIWSGLFHVIVQVNVIIKNAENNKDAFESEMARSIILGEAYAIRAYCQLDVLRLFGQLPQQATQKVQLPYSGTTAFDEGPDYCDFDAYVSKLKSDLTKAESLLKDNDPVFDYTFSQLNYPRNNLLEDDYLYYRQSRLNYWAVKGLEARMYLYLGKKEEAYTAAKAILDATGADGNPVMALSGATDINQNRYACPGECLFYLSKYNLKTVASILIGNADVQARSSYLYISSTQLTKDLYDGQATESHNRYRNLWNTNVKDASNKVQAAIRKYWYADDAADKMTNFQLIPMLRMSEIYLIAIETTTSKTEANQLYATYMLDRAVQVQGDAFASLDVIPDIILAEYRREFYAEGQMFYTYKRKFVKQMLWNKEEITEEDYVLWNAVNKEFNA